VLGTGMTPRNKPAIIPAKRGRLVGGLAG
jgi:hypothetical protein